MPFTAIDTFPENPDVQIFFNGLLLLHPDQTGKRCIVGVHNAAAGHKLSIDVRVKGQDPADPSILRLFGLEGEGLKITIEESKIDGVKKFVPPGELDRANGNADPRDFRWAIDLRRPDPNPATAATAFDLIPQRIQPGIALSDGVLFTARRTDPGLVGVQLRDPQNNLIDLQRTATTIGGNIYLNQGGRAIFEWLENGTTKRLILPKSDDGRCYVVNVNNAPGLISTGQPTHSEFLEYYRATNVQNADRFDLAFNAPGLDPSGSDRAPCLSVVVGG